MENTSLSQLNPETSNSHPLVEDFQEEMLVLQRYQEALVKILEKWPNEFEKDLYKQYKYFSAILETDFTMHRSMHHHLRILCSHYLMRKNLIIHQQSSPTEIDLEFRLIPAQLEFPFGQKTALGIAICIYLPDSYKLFENRHIFFALQMLISNIRSLQESFLTIKQHRDPFYLIYLEIEKTDRPFFSLSEIRHLKKQLKEELIRHVEVTLPPIFGQCNIEETMKNIIVLSKEVQSDKDLPQVMISFYEMLEKSLVFQVILVRPLENSTPSIEHCFQKVQEEFLYVSERKMLTGDIPSEYKATKEAHVFHIHIPKLSNLLRSNSSLNYLEARQYVLSIMTTAFGEVRDYNGGIFAKQQELFYQFKEQFKELAEKNVEILEEFFYGLNPPEIKAILPLSSLCQFFELYLQVKSENLPKQESIAFKTQILNESFFGILFFRDSDLEQEVKNILERDKVTNQDTISLFLKDNKSRTLGYVFQDVELGKKFKKLVNKSIKNWEKKLQNAQILRLCVHYLPISLDPRFSGEHLSGAIIKLLFEGLMYLGKNEKLEFGIANSVKITKNKKEYIFKLRKCFWTNGDLVTAYDFCYSWKKILSPNYNSPSVYLFYNIKNARKANKGEVPLEKIGIEAIDDLTLKVQLEHPDPFFLKCVTLPIFFPVNHRIDSLHPNWSLQKDHSYVSNGAFQMTPSNLPETYKLKKNPHYWNHDQVKLDSIQIIQTNPKKAIEMYKRDQIDWLGRPFTSWKPLNHNITSKKTQDICTYLYIFNVKCFPFQSVKIRQALSLAIDKQAFLPKLSNSIIPAFSPIPPIHSQFTKISTPDVQQAKKLFEEGLKELGINRRSFPSLVVAVENVQWRQEIAISIVKQWKEIFGIKIVINSFQFKKLFEKMINKQFQIIATNWVVLINNPFYTFNAFKYPEDLINFPNWENSEYVNFLEKSQKASNTLNRNELLYKAEEILIHEKPVIPIFYELEHFKCKEYVDQLFPNKFYNIDFKKMSINSPKKSKMNQETFI